MKIINYAGCFKSFLTFSWKRLLIKNLLVEIKNTRYNQCISMWLSCKVQTYATTFMTGAKDICKHMWCYLYYYISYSFFQLYNCTDLHCMHLWLYKSPHKIIAMLSHESAMPTFSVKHLSKFPWRNSCGFQDLHREYPHNWTT